jgi:hypothetical protein
MTQEIQYTNAKISQVLLTNKNIIVLIFFSVLMAIGYWSHSDYGIGVDEPTNRQNGGVSLNHIIENYNLKIFETDNELHQFRIPLNEYYDKDYGVVFDLPAMVIERIFKLNSSENQYKLRKILSYFAFVVGLIFIYKITIKYYGDYRLALLAVLMVFSSPRIFGEAFYNSKDIFFMSVFSVATYRMLVFIEQPSIKSTLLFAVTAGLATDTRIAALLLVIVSIVVLWFKLIKKEITLKKVFFITCLILTLTSFFIILFWPWLWADPVGNFLTAVTNMSKFRLIRWELFFGEYYVTNNLPWYYLPAWVLITTPVLYIVLFIYGNFVIVKELVVKKKILQTNYVIKDAILLVLCFVPIISAILMKSVLYNGWRHFYFIYPAMILIAIKGLIALLSSSRYNKTKVFIISFLFILNFTTLAVRNATTHPLQFIYFNEIINFRQDLREKLPLDYAGLSIVQGLRSIINLESRENIKIAAVEPLNFSLKKAYLGLDNNEKSRIELIEDIFAADYIITDYQFFDPQTANSFRVLKSKLILVHSIKVDKQIILSVFKNQI